MPNPMLEPDNINEDILAFMAGSPTGILISDRQGVIHWCNPLAAQLFGYEDLGLIGRSIEELLPPQLRGWHKVQRGDFYKDPQPRLMGKRENLSGVHRDGHPVPLLVGLSEVVWGEQTMVISHVVDHTRQKQAEDDLRLQQALAQAFAEAEDFDTAVTQVLARIGARVGASYAEAWLPDVEGDGFQLHLNWGEDSELSRRAATAAQTGQAQGAQIKLQCWLAPDPIWLAEGLPLMRCATAVGMPIHNQRRQIIALLGFYFPTPPDNERPITDLIGFTALQLGNMLERKQSAQKLQQYARDLESSHQQLAQTNKDLELFAMFASHDLRAPVRAIHSYAQLLKIDYGQLLPPEGTEFLQQIQDSTQQMDALIHGLLAYARLGQNAAPEKKDINTKELLVKLIDGLQLPADARVRVAVDMPQVISNALLLRQIFENLLSNALKYRKQDIPLEVLVDGRETDSAWILSVQDNGIGILPKFFTKIFELLQRLHAHHEYEGTGIGLALTRRCVELLGGEITVDSVPGAGSTFTFSLPKPLED